METGSRPILERENPAFRKKRRWCHETQSAPHHGRSDRRKADCDQLDNSDHAAADVRVLYDSEENVIKDTYPIYHKQ